jgi:hypothetical protein
MSSSNRWIAFITKLNRQTQEGRIQWKLIGEQPDLLNSDFQQYGPAYIAEADDDATVRMYKERTRRIADTDEEYWQDAVVLDIRTSDRGDFVRAPRTPGLDDLYEAVVYKANEVEGFLDRFLNKS